MNEFRLYSSQYLLALKVWPDGPETHRNIGILYELYMGRLRDAQQHYLQYLSLREKQGYIGDDTSYRQVKGWSIDLSRRLKKVGKL